MKFLYEKLIKSKQFNDGAAYISPNGDFIELSNKEAMHREIAYELANDLNIQTPVRELIDSEYEGDVALWYMTWLEGKLNYIRVNSGTAYENRAYIVLPPNQISDSQYKSLLNFLDKVAILTQFKGDIEIDIANKYKTFNFRDYITDDIIKEIKRYYAMKRWN